MPEGAQAQDKKGRPWYILRMLRWYISRSKEGGPPAALRPYVRDDNLRPRLALLK